MGNFLLMVKWNRARLLQADIAIATLLALPVVGFLASKLVPGFVLLVPLLASGLLALVHIPELGLAAILLAGVFVRFRIPTGTASEIPISLIVAVVCVLLWLIRLLVVDKRLSLRATPVNRPLLAFMFTVIIAWLWSRAFRDPLVHEAGHPLVSVAAGLVMMLLPASLLWTTNTLCDARWPYILTCLLLAEGLVVLVIQLGAHFRIGFLYDVAASLYSSQWIGLNIQGLLSMWCLAFALSLALLGYRIPWGLRFMLLIYAGMWVYWGYILRTSWLSGWVPAFVAAAVIAFLRSRKLFLVFLVVIIFAVVRHYLATQFETEAQISGITRLQAYRVNWRITGRHILFGTGPAGYASYYMSYFPDEAMASHSNYIDLIAQTGIVGSFFYLWFFAAQILGNYRLWRRLKGCRDTNEALVVAILGGTVGCLAAMALGDWLLPFAYTQSIAGFDLAVFNWIFMGMLWIMGHHTREEQGMAQGLYKIGQVDRETQV